MNRLEHIESSIYPRCKSDIDKTITDYLRSSSSSRTPTIGEMTAIDQLSEPLADFSLDHDNNQVQDDEPVCTRNERNAFLYCQ